VLASNGAATVLLQSPSASFTNTDHEQVIDANYADALSGLDALSTNSASSSYSGDTASASFTTESALKLTTKAAGSIGFSGSTSASASGPDPGLGLAESTLLTGAYAFNTTAPEVVTLTYNSTASVSLADAWSFTVSSGESVLFTQSLSSTSSGRIIVDLPSAGHTNWALSCPPAPFPMRPRSSLPRAEAHPARLPPRST
jgi:hypothetical protein